MHDNETDTNGEPASFSPHELRIGGHWIVKVLILALVIVVLYMIFS